MDEYNVWKPFQANYDGSCIEIYYVNELGEEYVHVTDTWGFWESSYRPLCWSQCSGDWPGCKKECPLYTGPVNEMLAEWKEDDEMPPPDPFNFMLNHECYIDDNNFYVEEFDTLDGIHWEIAIDIGDQILDCLDNETA